MVVGALVSPRGQPIGADASRSEDAWQIGHRGGLYRGGPVSMSALSGLDQALWDIKRTRPRWNIVFLGLTAWLAAAGLGSSAPAIAGQRTEVTEAQALAIGQKSIEHAIGAQNAARYRPYRAHRDGSNWVVEGTFHGRGFGGFPFVKVAADGKVILPILLGV